jgi:hypothetical protein
VDVSATEGARRVTSDQEIDPVATYERGKPTFERFRDGWLLVFPDGAIGCRHVMDEDTARAMARLSGFEFPGA